MIYRNGRQVMTVDDRRAMQEAVNRNREREVISVSWMSKKDVLNFIGGQTHPLSPSALNNWIKTKGFPKPRRISKRYPVWEKKAVQDWMLSQPLAENEED